MGWRSPAAPVWLSPVRARRSPGTGRNHESGSVIVLLLVVLAVLGGGWWYLRSHRTQREAEAAAFVNEVATRLVLKHDVRFLDLHLTPQAQMLYPPSFRMRMMDLIDLPGTPNPQFHVKGELQFTHQFSDPNGRFIAQFDYPSGPSYLEMQISHPGAMWMIDAINWTWTPPAPTPTPMPVATPTPTPTPRPSPSPKRRH